MQRNQEIEAAMVGDPGDPLGYLAFAEWLKDGGEPWGEFIEAQIEAQEAGRDPNEGEQIARLRQRTIGCLRQRQPGLDGVELNRDELQVRWGMADAVWLPDATQTVLAALEDPFFLLTRSLDLFQAAVADLGPLAALQRLEELNLAETKVTDLSPLSGLAYLAVLNLTETGVSDLTPLSGCPALRDLNLDNTPVQDLSPLIELTGLRHLNLPVTHVRDIRPLMRLEKLESLCLCDTEVDEVQVEAIRLAIPGLDIEY